MPVLATVLLVLWQMLDESDADGGMHMKKVILTAFKYGGQPHCSQPLLELHRSAHEAVLFGPIGAPFFHHTRGRRFAFPEAALYICTDHRPYLPVILAPPRDGVRLYCHMATPCQIGPDTVRFIDLDLDVLRSEKGPPMLVDEDEYRDHRTRLNYPAPLMHWTEQGARAAMRDIAAGIYPFDDTMQRFSEAVRGLQEGEIPDLSGVLR